MPETRRASRIVKAFALCAILGALGIVGLFGFLWLERRTEVTLPVPTGSFAVGRAIYDWKDDVALDTLAPIPGTKRELLVWIWYPAVAGPSAAIDDYLPAQLRPRGDSAGPPGFFGLLTRDASKVRGHSIRHADLSPGERPYPVVIMRAGASAEVLNYSTLAEDLASHGYVVVGFDAPYRTGQVVFPDGRMMRRTEENNPEICVVPDRAQMERCATRVLTAWTGDIGFVLDRLALLNASDSSGKFTGGLNMTRAGVFGHSFGGAAAAQFCHEDSRCKAGIDIDGAPHGSVIHAGLRQPFMFLLSDHGDASDSASKEIDADIQSIYDRSPPESRLRVAITGAFHFVFSDDGALLKSSVVRGLLRAFGKLGMSGRRQLAVTVYCVHRFFDAYLQGDGLPPRDFVTALSRDPGLSWAAEMKFSSIMKHPSAFLPVAMSTAALLLVLVTVARFGVVHEADEGAAAHIWQLLMGLQLPIVLWFAVSWLPRAPKQALYVLALQAGAGLAALAPVFLLGL